MTDARSLPQQRIDISADRLKSEADEARIRNLTLENKRLRDALEHYADPRSWLNEREHRGLPGFHSRDVAANALTGMERPDARG